jgi:catechol 2,3-dioxygenase-like lactoylglutathione lyase family enzyme
MATLATPSHLGLCVRDLEASVRFYNAGLGFELAERYELDDRSLPGLDAALEVDGPVRLSSQFVELHGLRIELLHFSSPVGSGTPSTRRNQPGLTHLAFNVDDVDAVARRLVDHGGSLIGSTRSRPGVDLVFVADPDGVRIELMAGPG